MDWAGNSYLVTTAPSRPGRISTRCRKRTARSDRPRGTTRSACVRATIARAESNGQAFSVPWTQVTEIQYERALARQRELEQEIAQLEARRAVTRQRQGLATFGTRMA